MLTCIGLETMSVVARKALFQNFEFRSLEDFLPPVFVDFLARYFSNSVFFDIAVPFVDPWIPAKHVNERISRLSGSKRDRAMRDLLRSTLFPRSTTAERASKQADIPDCQSFDRNSDAAWTKYSQF